MSAHRVVPDVITVENRPELGRYQLCADGEVAGYLAYELHGAHVALMHTQIEEQFAGEGLGALLVEHALGDIRRQGRTVPPFCPFVRSFIARHPAYVDLVPADRRAAFDLVAGSSSTGDDAS
jgi:uncharacterized protein